MAIQVPPVAAPEAFASATIRELTSNERWAAWEVKGAAHERTVRRRMAVAAPVLIVVAAFMSYGLLPR